MASLCQNLRKGTVSLSSLVFIFVLWQLWVRFSMSSRFAMAVPSSLVKTDIDVPNSTVLEDFPKRIWTTGPLSPMRIKKEDADRVRTWMDLNMEYRYELLTDGSAETYVKDHFPQHSKIRQTYLSLSDFIMRADLIRYLALLQDGGVYNDLDVGCLRPIDLWIPPPFKANTSVVLGIEVDNEMGPEKSKLFELVNWTIMSRRNAPFMRFLVDRVIGNLEKDAAAHNTTLANLQPKRQEVIDVTGPAALTEATFQYLSEKTQTTVNMHNFTKMRRPKLVADILVLPINAFGAGHLVQWSGTDEDGSALVHHYFAGSWKTTHFDGPTEEEKKAEEAKKNEEARKKQEEEDRKRKEEEDTKRREDEDRKKTEEEERKNKEEQDRQKKAEEDRTKIKEQYEKKKAEEDRKKKAETSNQQIAIENQSTTQSHNADEGQGKGQEQGQPSPQGDQDQQNGQQQDGEGKEDGGAEQDNGQEKKHGINEAEQPAQAPQAEQAREDKSNAKPVNAKEKVSLSVLKQERRKAIEGFNRVNAVRTKTREEAIKKIQADRERDMEERKKDEENKKKLVEVDKMKAKQRQQQAPVQNVQPAPVQG
ncbi:MAG: hypothetical protein Q9192_004415 [Flavoplaca navasiana]